MANQSGPESCAVHREVQGEALTGETGGPAIEPRNQESGMPMLLSEAEGNMEHGVTRQSCSDPARSKTLSTPGSLLHGNWEISSAPDAQASGGTGKAKSRNPVVHAEEKSDTPVVPRKPSNKGDDPARGAGGNPRPYLNLFLSLRCGASAGKWEATSILTRWGRAAGSAPVAQR